MNELARTKDALQWAQAFMLIMGNSKMLDGERLAITKEYSEKVAAALNPPPVYESVEEIVGWVNVYRYQDGRYEVGETLYPEEGDANENAGPFRISCQPIKVTVSREKKQPVERSVSAEVALVGDKMDEIIIPLHDFPQWEQTLDKTGTLTFTWEE
jgi:hypothetical protein